MATFCSLVHESVNIILYPDSSDGDLHLQKAIANDPNKLLMFQEQALDRQWFKSPGGPFEAEVIQTKAGIFSATVWHTITFNSPFARTEKMVFDSLDD
jgi:hypothetical protein